MKVDFNSANYNNLSVVKLHAENNNHPMLKPEMHHTVKHKEKREIRDDILQKSVEQANESLKSANRYFQRSIHEKTGTIIYTLYDSVTEEVIAEFPERKLQDMIANMWENAGLFVDEKA